MLFIFTETSPPRESQAYLAIIIGVLVAVSLLLAAAIFFMILRHRQRKSLSGSPLPDKAGWVAQPSPRLLGGQSAVDHLDVDHHHPMHGSVGSGQQQQNQRGGGGGKIYSKNSTLVGYGNVADLSRSSDAGASQYLLPHGSPSAIPHGHLVMHNTKTEYQEPYHALRFSPYYSYSTLLLAGTEGHQPTTTATTTNNKINNHPSTGK